MQNYNDKYIDENNEILFAATRVFASLATSLWSFRE